MAHLPRGQAAIELEKAIVYNGADCLTGAWGIRHDGYPVMRLDGKVRPVGKFICDRIYGPRPPGFDMAHSCGNRACVNPVHLRWASRSDNQMDRVLHGTSNRGERFGRVKLTEQQVREIRALAGLVSRTELARRYGTTQPNISLIISRKNWGWLI